MTHIWNSVSFWIFLSVQSPPAPATSGSTDINWIVHGAMEKTKCWKSKLGPKCVSYSLQLISKISRSSIEKNSKCHLTFPFALFWPATSETCIKKREWHTLTPMHLHTSSKMFPCGGVFLYSPLPAMNTTEKYYNPNGNSHDLGSILHWLLGRIPHPCIQQKSSALGAYRIALLTK